MGGYCEGCGCQGHCTCGEPVIDVAALTARIAELEEENARLNGVIESNIDNGIDKIMAMSDEQVSALAGFEGSNPEDKATIARQCMDIAMLRVDLAASQAYTEQLREKIEALWGIIDDIDSYGDMAKADDKLFRSLVEKRQKDRWETGITTDGYVLNMPIPRDTSALDAYVAKRLHDMACDKGLLRIQVEELTRQRDLAVEAITLAIDMVGHPDNITYLQQTLDAIKGSEGK